MHVLKAIACVFLVCGACFFVMRRLPANASQQTSTPSPGTPADAEEVHAEIHAVESVLPKLPDRGAALFLLARRYAHVGDLQKALALLKECVALDAGFEPDPDHSPSLRSLASNEQFREMLQKVRRRYRPEHKANVAFTVPASGAVSTNILHFFARVLGVYGQGLFHGQPLTPETVSAVPSSDRVVRFSRPSPPRHTGQRA